MVYRAYIVYTTTSASSSQEEGTGGAQKLRNCFLTSMIEPYLGTYISSLIFQRCSELIESMRRQHLF